VIEVRDDRSPLEVDFANEPLEDLDSLVPQIPTISERSSA